MHLATRSGGTPKNASSSKIFASSADFNAAFRNLRCTASAVAAFGVHVPDLNVVAFDLSAAFGWTGSPAFYGVAGNGISHLLSNESPHTMSPHETTDNEPFFGFEYVDDHISIEIDVGDRLDSATCALKLAMMATLGPHCVNEKKCTGWTQQFHALGLDWDLVHCTVSMPLEKVTKAYQRTVAVLEGTTITKLQLQQLIGSLRHVCTCNPSARAFLQRIQTACNRTTGRHPVPTSDDLRADARVFAYILQHSRLQGIPLEIFSDIQAPDLHLYMDASDSGLAILDPSGRRFIQVCFDTSEIELVLRNKLLTSRHPSSLSHPRTDDAAAPNDSFSINVREFLSVIFAIATWGADWANAERPVHIRAVLDNTSAIKWTNALTSPNLLGQRLCRTLSCLLARHGVRVTAQHLPGEQNTMADAGSRASESAEHTTTWSSFTKNWTECQVPAALRKIYSTSDAAAMRWRHRPANDTEPIGPNGQPGARLVGTHDAYPPLATMHRANSTTLHFSSTGDHVRSKLSRSDPRFAASIGTISAPMAPRPSSMPDMPPPSRASNVTNGTASLSNQSPPSFSGPSDRASTATTPTTAPYGALRSWAFSSLCGPPSMPARQPAPTTTSAAETSRSKGSTATDQQGWTSRSKGSTATNQHGWPTSSP